jgi:hypothetical protein
VRSVGSGSHCWSPTDPSLRTSACTAASVPRKRAASTHSDSAARAGESSSSALGRSRADTSSRAAEVSASRGPRATRVTSALGKARSLRCTSAMIPNPPKPPT